jgi:hypothetical protein
MRELKFIEHFNKNNDLYQMVKIYVWCWMHIMKYILPFCSLKEKYSSKVKETGQVNILDI